MQLIRPHVDEEGNPIPVEIDGKFYGYIGSIILLFIVGALLQRQKLRKERAKEDLFNKDLTDGTDYGGMAGNQTAPSPDVAEFG